MRTQSIIRCFLLVIVLGWGGITANTASASGSLQKAASARDPSTRSSPLPIKEMRSAGSYQAGTITITDVTSASNGSFKAGDVITIQVHLSAEVIVNVNSGTPRLRLATNEPLTTAVDYTGPTDPLTTNSLTFTYTVAPGDTASDLDYASSAALELNGSTITGLSEETVELALPDPGAAGSLGYNNAIRIDTTAPTLTFDLQAGSDSGNPGDDLTNAATLIFDAQFSEAVSGFEAPPLTSSGSAANCDLSVGIAVDNIYPVTVTNCGEGDLTLSLNSSLVQDAAGNPVGPTTGPTVTIDRTGPTVTLSAPLKDPVNGSISVSINVGGSPVNFDPGKISASNASISGFGGTLPNYSFTLTPTAEGDFNVYTQASAATDMAGNESLDSNTILRTYDATRPSVSFDLQDTSDTGVSNSDNLTNTAELVVDAIITESTTGISYDDFTNEGTALDCTFAIGTANGNRYPLTVSGCKQGTVIVRLSAGRLTDAAGNLNVQIDSGPITIDRTGPTVTLAAPLKDPVNAAISVSVTVGEPVPSFNSGNIVPFHASVGGFGGSGASYSFTLTPTIEGVFDVHIQAGAAADAAGNPSQASNSISRTYDGTRPGVGLSSGAPNPTNTATIPVTVAFTESVSDFTSDDISLTNATISPVTGSGSSYSFNLIASTPGSFSAEIPADKAQDTAGNLNTASNTLLYSYDNSAPTVSLSSLAPAFTNLAAITVDVLFSEAVTGFELTDILTTNGSASNLTGSGNSYSFTLTASSQAAFTAQVAVNAAHDSAGNNNTASTVLSRTYDSTPPTPTLLSSAPNPTNTAPIPYTVTFNESVSDFTEADLTLVNATVTGFSGSGATYSFGLTPTGQVQVSASIAANQVHDAALNGNPPAGPVSRIYDSVGPTVTITSDATNPTNLVQFLVTVTFSEPVADFVQTDMVVGTHGNVSNFAGAGTTYTFDLRINGQGNTATIDIPPGVATDDAGNGNSAALQFSRTLDTVAPTVSIEQKIGQADPTNTAPVLFTVTFSEPVSDFLNGDVTPGGTAGATTATVSGSGTTYTVSVSGMTSSGTVTASLIAGVAQDAAGNASAASTSVDNTVTYDTQAPTVTINQAAGQADPVNTSPIQFQVVFSEVVTDFTTGEVSLSGGAGATTASVTGSGTTYTVSVSGMTGPGTVIASLAAGVAHDAAGNASVASTSGDNTVTYDNAPLTVTINVAGGQADPTNASPILFTAVFNKPVSDFVSGEVALSGTAVPGASLVSGTGTTYTIAVSGMSGSGTIIANIAAGVAHDAAGNSNTASTSTDNTVTYDVTRPTVTINQAPAQLDPTNNSPVEFAVVFSKPVTGFTTGDVTLGGTALPSLGAVSGSGSTYTVSVSGMAGSGTITASIAADVAQDALGNTNTASTSTDANVTYDITLPVFTGVAPATGAFINSIGTASDVSYSLSEPLSSGYVTITWESGSTDTGAPHTCTLVGGALTAGPHAAFDMTNTTNGCAAAPVLKTGAVYSFSFNGTDPAGNPADPVTHTGITFDTTAPTVTVNQDGTQADPTNTSPIKFAIIFSEPVTDFVSGDVTIGGTAAPTTKTVSGTGPAYLVSVSGMTLNGTVTASLAAGVAFDAAGNANLGSTSTDNSVVYDTIAPTVTINQDAGQADPTNTAPILFTVAFNEPVTDFITGDVTRGGTAGATTALVSGSGSSYTVSVSGMTQNGTVTASLAAGVAIDAAGNASAASTSTDNSVTYDTLAPTVTINQAVGQGDPTRTSPIQFQAVFSEAVADFTTGEVTLGGTAAPTTGTVGGTGTTYTVSVSGMAQNGTVTASLAAGVAHDAAGNASAASASTDNSVTYDTLAPTVTFTLRPASDTGISSSDNITNAATLVFDAAFSEPISGLATTDITFSGTSSGCTFSIGAADVNTYPVTASSCTPGLMTIRMIAGGVADLAGNPIIQTDGTQVTIDRAGPSVTLSSSAPAVTNISPIPVTVLFTEPVTGLLAAELTLSNGTVGEFTGSGASYSFNLYPSATGTVTAAIPGSAAIDTAGNPNSASLVFSRVYDTVAPAVAMTSAAPANTKTSPIPVTVTFSKSVTGFTAGDIVPTNGVVSGFAGSGTTYTFNLVPSGQGEVKADIAAGVAQDTAGNGNTAASTFSRVFDTIVPTVVTFQLQAASDTGIASNDKITNASTLVFDAVFSEAVVGFTPAKLSKIGSATGCVFAVGLPDENSYPVTVTSCSAGTLTVRLATGGVTDLAGNAIAQSDSDQITIDHTTPGLTFDLQTASDTGSSTTDNITNASAPIVNAVFNDVIYGIDSTDFANSGTAGSCAITVGTNTGNTYPLVFSSCGEGTLVPLLNAGFITDAAGNAIGQTDGLTIQIDRTPPVAAMASATSNPTSSPSIPVTVTFTEPVVNFIVADITSVNGTLANFAGAGAAYSFNLLPSAQGLVSASIVIGVSTDTAGNGSTAATISRTFDSLSPTVTLSSVTNPTTNVSPIPVTVTFNEPVSGFISGDIIPGNAALSNFSGTGASYTFNLVPLGQGQVTASIYAGVAADASGNGNVAPPQFSRTYDSLPPLVTFDLEDLSDSGKSTTDNLTNASILIVDAIFSEPITGLTQADLSNTGTSRNCVIVPGTPIGNTVPLTVSACTPGTVILRLAAGGVTDTAGNVNGQIDGQTITVDRTRPTVTWTKPVSSQLSYFTYHQTVRLEITATDNFGVDRVVFSRYNRCGPDEHIGTVTSAPYWVNYDTTGLCHTGDAYEDTYDGNNEIDAEVVDLAGNSLVNYIMLNDIPALTVTFSGGGFGTVTSNPAAINCTNNCSYGWSVETQLVTLTAVPNGTSLFTGWGGACTGTGTCQVTMGMLSQDRAVTASFVSTTKIFFPLIVR